MKLPFMQYGAEASSADADHLAPTSASKDIRLGILGLAALLVALLIGIVALQVPAAKDMGAPPTAFSSARAMVDIEVISRAPHPVGTADHQRVQDYLFGRMQALGLTPERQTGVLSPRAVRRIQRWGLDPSSPVVNLVGILPASGPDADNDAPAVMLMAHYDSSPTSPGAADNSTGVAGVLEAVRTLKARGPINRPLIVLLTDAEELDLDGARTFFSEHRLRDRIGAVVNLEARGGGGRAIMFETGPGNSETIDLFAASAVRASGGPNSNSLAVLVYEKMPNGTDFTIARQRGLTGINLAFIGRPSQYHSASSTPENLDQGAVQHIGGQAVEVTDALLRAETLPVAGENRVYADLMGLAVVSHSRQAGWWVFIAAAALTAFGFWGGRHLTGLRFTDVARGMAEGLWLVTSGLVVTAAFRLLAGPLSSREMTAESYYTLLARLPWIEAGAALVLLAGCLVVLAGREIVGRLILTSILAGSAGMALILTGSDSRPVQAAALIALILTWTVKSPVSSHGGWVGLIALVCLLGGAVQAVAPEAAFLLLWPALLASIALAVSTLLMSRTSHLAGSLAAVLATAAGGGWIVYMAHPVFLGIGMDLPGVFAPLALLILIFVYPLGRAGLSPRGLTIAACISLLLGGSLNLVSQWLISTAGQTNL